MPMTLTATMEEMTGGQMDEILDEAILVEERADTLVDRPVRRARPSLATRVVVPALAMSAACVGGMLIAGGDHGRRAGIGLVLGGAIAMAALLSHVSATMNERERTTT